MKIYSGLQRGSSHKDYCEDFLMTLPITNSVFVCMVSDGCSSGSHSHFASALLCKLMRKVIVSKIVDSTLSIKVLAMELLKLWMEELKKFRTDFFVPQIELLATFNFLIFNQQTKQAFVVVLGDGAVVIDNELYEIDQHNAPDYPAYHLDDSPDLLQMYLEENTFWVENPDQIGIASDGVFSFQYTEQIYEVPNSQFAAYLLTDTSFKDYESMIYRKINALQNIFKVYPYDDVAIIRIIFNGNRQIEVSL